MNAPEHKIAQTVDGSFVVEVGPDGADFVSRDAEHPGLWVVGDSDGRFMGRHIDCEAGAAYLVTRFAARDEGEGCPLPTEMPCCAVSSATPRVSAYAKRGFGLVYEAVVADAEIRRGDRAAEVRRRLLAAATACARFNQHRI